MAILPNTQNSTHHNLILARMKYEYTKGALGSNETLLKAYIVLMDNPENPITINADAPLLAPRTGVNFKFLLNTLLANKNLYENNAYTAIKSPKIYFVSGLWHNFLVQVGEEKSEVLPFIYARLPDDIFEQYEQTYLENLRRFGNPFFTLSPRIKRTKSTTPQYLHYINNLTDTPTSITFNCTLYLHDGTKNTFQIDTVEGIIRNEIIGCNVALNKIIDTNNAPEDVARYEIYLTNQAQKQITETRVFIVDDSFAEDTITILFRNGFGVFETIEFDGQAVFTDDYTFNTFQAENELIDYDTTVVQKLNLKTAALEKDWLKYIAENLMISDETYWVLPDGRHRRLSKTTKSLKKFDSRAITETAELEFRVAKL